MMKFLIALAGVISGWVVLCTIRTFFHRQVILDAMHFRQDWPYLRHDLHNVSVERHIWTLMTLGNYKKLYSTEVQNILERHQLGYRSHRR
jgi:hypothetical protein